MSLATALLFIFKRNTLLVLLAGLSIHTTQAEVLLVNPTATGPGNRLATVTADSWNNTDGYTSIESAFNAAQAGDEIWVKAGIYKPTQNNTGTSTGATDPTNTFLIPSGVSLYGGFAGTEVLLASRNPVTNETTLSGDFNGNDVVNWSGNNLAFSNQTENVLHVITIENPTAPVHLEGFTVRGGFAQINSTYLGVTSGNRCGGGLFAVNGGSYISITSCNFTANNTNINTGATGGGALYFYNCSPTVSNCIFKDNRGRNGGAISCTQNSHGIFSNCVIQENYSFTAGGGAYSLFGSQPIFSKCVFYNNYSNSLGGAMYNENGCSPVITNSIFLENTTVNKGGAINNNFPSFPVITNCIFYNNQATAATAEGGAIYFYNTAGGTIKNCIFKNNTTPANAGSGIREEFFSNNATVATRVTISNTIMSHALPITNINDGGNNSSVDPAFINVANPIGADNAWFTADDGFQLTSCSPAIDAGTFNGAPSEDFLGAARPMLNAYDIGAYEVVEFSISPGTYSVAEMDVAFNATLSQGAMTGAVTWNVSSGALPDGITLNTTTGELTGTPSVDGIYNFTLTATETSTGCTHSKDVSINVYNPLPVIFTDFQAICLDRTQVQLNWQTSSEINNKLFEIERSDNGSDFVKIDELTGTGNSTTSNNYSYTDHHTGAAYYRLKQVDMDGTYSYSEIQFVNGEKEVTYNAYPNPFEEVIVLYPIEESAHVSLVGMNGEEIHLQFIKEGDRIFFNTQEIPSGVYILTIRDEGNVSTNKMIKY